MESIIEVVVGIGPRLAQCIFHIMESHYTSKVANLSDQVGKLNNSIRNMRDRVDVAKGNGEVILDGVQHWLESATEISRRAEDFLNVNRDRANVSCCNVQIPNLVSRRKLSREAKQMVEDLQREIQAAQGFDVVASRPALHTNIAMRGDYKDFGSRKTILEDIMKALQDCNVSRIGIYGIGGIGKTTLAKEVARQVVEEAKLFTEGVMTTVSRPPDFSRMQREIAEKIGLDIKGIESIPARADRLQRRLKEEKSILIILDDIWDELDLIEVGIHLENEGCKILMTSRSQDVLRSMGANRYFPVDDLSASEGMNLFRTIVGDIVEQRDFNSLAIDVVRECGGLPLAIKVVAGPLKSQNNLSVWRNTLNQLRSIISPTNIAEPLREVYRSIRLSYDSLADEDKSLLLLCSLYGEDTDILVEDLRMIGVGCGLFQNVSTLADARMRVESLVVKLKDRCLLLGGDDDDDDWVKMHDVIRDVAVSIASNEGGMHSVTINELEDCQNKKKLKDSKAISLLRHPDFNQLPERLECSELELLLLHSGQGGPIPIPTHFLEGSKDQLKSLFLCQAKLVPVPSSFHSLQNLQTLCLRGCVLKDVNFIGDLKNLQILDLSKSTITQLPVKVAQLSRLQLLNLEGCRDLKLIEPNVISSLIQLEELYIAKEFDKWEVGEVDVSRRSNVNLAEIENLQQLTSLSLRVPDAKTFPKDFKFSEKLERYRISIGDPLGYLDSTGISRSLLLNLRERSQLTTLGLESLMNRSEGLLLDGLIDVKNVVYDLDSEGFCDLKRLYLKNSDGVQYIVDCVDQQIHPHKAFPVLESLRLEGLRNLERMYHGELPEDSFKNLREVRVGRCEKLKNVFPLFLFKRLHSVEVNNCKMVEEIVGHVRLEDDGAVEFSELRSLELRNLPKMVKFMGWSKAEAAGGSSSVESPDPLFGEKVALPSLEDLFLNKLVVKKLWPDQIPATSYMQNLSSLNVVVCNNLKYVSSFAAAKSFLIKLKKLKVSRCSVLEEVLVITDLQGEDDGSLEKISLPQLKSLELHDLPNLKRFCKHPDELETLVTSIELTGEGSEHKEVEFGTEEPLFSEMVELPSLEELTLNELGAKILWADQLASTSYVQNLSSLQVIDCGNLKYVSSFAMAKSCLIKLKKLEVYACSVLEEVLAITDLQGQDDGSLEKISLPQLKSLMLWNLPYLKRFCKNPHELKMLETNSMSTEITVDRAEPEEIEFSAKESLFNGMLEFPGLERLDLYGLNAVESVWQLQTTCYMVNLTSLSVRNCKSLKYVFSLTVAERLVKLKELRVYNCEVMEDIVVTKELGEEGRSGNKILFPQLQSLTLSKLLALRKFCHEEVILPKLESLSTDWSEAITEMQGTSKSSSTLSLCHRQLKELKLNFSHQDKPFALSICKLLQRCHNLEKLQLNGFLVNEVGAAAQEYDGQLITRLRELRLDNVPKLRHLFGEPENDHPVGGASQPVKTLFVSFQNLTILEVSFCHRLTYLLASSTATSLVQLKEMRVTDCNRMTEIITDYREGEITEGEHDREFVFPQLEILVLRHLPNLGSFFSGNNVMRFPKLKKLFVSQCPEMRTFSHGIIISSSMLNTIIAEIYSEWMWKYTNELMNRAKAVREHWDGDVNTTVRQLREDDSDLALQQLFAETDVHYSGEGTSVTGS